MDRYRLDDRQSLALLVQTQVTGHPQPSETLKWLDQKTCLIDTQVRLTLIHTVESYNN